MKVFELQKLCDEWGIQTSGKKSDLVDRLQLLFHGEPVLRKNCTAKFVKLIEEDASDHVSGTFRSFSAGQVPDEPEPKDPKKLPVGTIPKAKSIMPPKPPRKITAHDLEVGESVVDLHCPKCNEPMVVRANRVTGDRFFGCSGFAVGRCSATRPLGEGLKIINAAKAGKGASASSGGY
jgi:predicted RNA-binding Zn-ribbon protein involved in translation (DUF1610 family)